MVQIDEPRLRLTAPAKLNLFLHITGRRPDGYHCLQTVFQFLQYGDELSFEPRADDQIVLASPMPGVAPEKDLVVVAARALRARFPGGSGVTISRDKRLPLGGGLGGGSSDAATTLVALNHLWQLRLTSVQLQQVGLTLGADVPVFVYGRSCWAEGVGDHFTALELPIRWYIVVIPAEPVPTGALFRVPELTRDCSPITIRDFVGGAGRNVFESVVSERYPSVRAALEWLSRAARRVAEESIVAERLKPQGNRFSRMQQPALTGSGGCVFLACPNQHTARKLLAELPPDMTGFVARGSNRSMLYQSESSLDSGISASVNVE